MILPPIRSEPACRLETTPLTSFGRWLIEIFVTDFLVPFSIMLNNSPVALLKIAKFIRVKPAPETTASQFLSSFAYSMSFWMKFRARVDWWQHLVCQYVFSKCCSTFLERNIWRKERISCSLVHGWKAWPVLSLKVPPALWHISCSCNRSASLRRRPIPKARWRANLQISMS